MSFYIFNMELVVVEAVVGYKEPLHDTASNLRYVHHSYTQALQHTVETVGLYQHHKNYRQNTDSKDTIGSTGIVEHKDVGYTVVSHVPDQGIERCHGRVLLLELDIPYYEVEYRHHNLDHMDSTDTILST